MSKHNRPRRRRPHYAGPDSAKLTTALGLCQDEEEVESARGLLTGLLTMMHLNLHHDGQNACKPFPVVVNTYPVSFHLPDADTCLQGLESSERLMKSGTSPHELLATLFTLCLTEKEFRDDSGLLATVPGSPVQNTLGALAEAVNTWKTEAGCEHTHTEIFTAVGMPGMS